MTGINTPVKNAIDIIIQDLGRDSRPWKRLNTDVTLSEKPERQSSLG